MTINIRIEPKSEDFNLYDVDLEVIGRALESGKMSGDNGAFSWSIENTP